ncbi:MAG: hypothetical protein AB1601_02885 [Planctomycetota bacterium]
MLPKPRWTDRMRTRRWMKATSDLLERPQHQAPAGAEAEPAGPGGTGPLPSPDTKARAQGKTPARD